MTMTKREHAAFIRGLESASKIANTIAEIYADAMELASIGSIKRAAYDSRELAANVVRDKIRQRIRREKRKARKK